MFAVIFLYDSKSPSVSEEVTAGEQGNWRYDNVFRINEVEPKTNCLVFRVKRE